MFRVRIKSTVKIQGCPANGLEAVEFRRANGLPPEPNDRLKLDIDIASEPLCLEFPDLLDGDADIPTDFYSGAPLRDFPIPPAVLAAIVPDEPGTLAPLLASYLEAARIRREQDEREERERAGRRAAEEAARAERKAREEAGLARLRQWGERDGSELLKARIAEGFDWSRLAVAEYCEAVAGSLGFGAEVDTPEGYRDGDVKDSATPTLDDIRALRLVRSRIASAEAPAVAELVWIVYRPEGDEDGHIDDDAEPIRRTEVRVTVTAPTGDERAYFYLPSAVIGADRIAGLQ